MTDEKQPDSYLISHDGISHPTALGVPLGKVTSTHTPTPPNDMDTEEGRERMVLARAEDLCRRAKAPKHTWKGVFDQHLEDYYYFIKYGNTNEKSE